MGELHALAEALMDRETLTGEEVREVFAAERQRSGGWLWKWVFGVRGRGAWEKKETMMTELDGRMKSLEMQVMSHRILGPKLYSTVISASRCNAMPNVLKTEVTHPKMERF